MLLWINSSVAARIQSSGVSCGPSPRLETAAGSTARIACVGPGAGTQSLWDPYDYPYTSVWTPGQCPAIFPPIPL